jgi:hypothetical protein
MSFLLWLNFNMTLVAMNGSQHIRERMLLIFFAPELLREDVGLGEWRHADLSHEPHDSYLIYIIYRPM